MQVLEVCSPDRLSFARLQVCITITALHVLYLDDSGSTIDPAQNHVVLGGVSLFERQTHWIGKGLDTIAARFNGADPASIELHGSPMLNGRGFWRRIPVSERVRAINDSLGLLANARSARVFAVAIEKATFGPNDAIEAAFEEICRRFDEMLMYLHRRGDTQRGVIIFDKSTKETTIQGLAREFKAVGHQWGVLRNMAEVPSFIDSKASRLVQLADLVAYSVFRGHEKNDRQFFQQFEHRIYQMNGVRHGYSYHGSSVPLIVPNAVQLKLMPGHP